MERLYTIPLGKSYDYIRTKRAKRAVKIISEFVARHMKVEKENVKISSLVNNKVWEKGIQKPPRKIRVKVIKEKAVAYVLLPEEKLEKPEKKAKKEEKKEKKEEKKKRSKKEEKKEDKK